MVEPLARKYRPKVFAELIGQSMAVRMLQHLLETQKPHPAILLCGMRGVGKTTLARLFAKGINCQQGLRQEPCGFCDHCLAIQKGEHVDVIEIDAASNTKVESIRELLENLPYAPSLGRYRVYILDEVHMLSRHSFNALLKILEEPPGHVQFIFATTEPEKIPDTVLSRLLTVRLAPVPSQEMVEHLRRIFEKEKIIFESESLPFLAQAAQGSVRDGLTLADQILAQGKGRITTLLAQALSVQTEEEKGLAWLMALHQHQFSWLAQQWSLLQDDPIKIDQLLCAMLRWVELICMSKAADVYAEPLRFPHVSDRNQLRIEQLKARSEKDWMRSYHALVSTRKEVAFAPTPLINFEMTCLRLLYHWPRIVKQGGSCVVLENNGESSEKTAGPDVRSRQTQETALTAPSYPGHATAKVQSSGHQRQEGELLRSHPMDNNPGSAELGRANAIAQTQEKQPSSSIDQVLKAYEKLSGQQGVGAKKKEEQQNKISIDKMLPPPPEFFKTAEPLHGFSMAECQLMSMPISARWRIFLWQSVFSEEGSNKILFSPPTEVLVPPLENRTSITQALEDFWNHFFQYPMVFEAAVHLPGAALFEKFLRLQEAQKEKLRQEAATSEVCALLKKEFGAVVERWQPNI